jgi:hypothetical protein
MILNKYLRKTWAGIEVKSVDVLRNCMNKCWILYNFLFERLVYVLCMITDIINEENDVI